MQFSFQLQLTVIFIIEYSLFFLYIQLLSSRSNKLPHNTGTDYQMHLDSLFGPTGSQNPFHPSTSCT